MEGAPNTPKKKGSIMDRMFRRNEESSVLVSGFESNAELDSIATQIAELHARNQGFEMHGGEDEQSFKKWSQVYEQLDHLLQNNGPRLHEYLSPYVGIELDFHHQHEIQGSAEWQRWFASKAVKQYEDGTLAVPKR